MLWPWPDPTWPGWRDLALVGLDWSSSLLVLLALPYSKAQALVSHGGAARPDLALATPGWLCLGLIGSDSERDSELWPWLAQDCGSGAGGSGRFAPSLVGQCHDLFGP